MGIIKFLEPGNGNFIVRIIEWLVKLGGAVWIGVVLFTLLLKLIALPFDYMSKASMRKNNIKMEAMREDLEKLQKQYANDKNLYNQKMMALYKKNGYSMWGSCLPTILTLVIFIVAINGFTTYSSIENQRSFYEMSKAYNSVIYEGFYADGTYIVKNADGSLTFVDEKIYNAELDENGFIKDTNIKVEKVEPVLAGEKGKITVYAGSCFSYSKEVSYNGDKLEFKITDYSVNADLLKTEEYNYLTIYKNGKTLTFSDYLSAKKQEAENSETEINEQEIASDFIKEIQQTRSANKFRETSQGFLWVKNIWVADNATKHPIESSWDTFKSTYKYTDNSVDAMKASDYNSLIAKLDKEKTEPNGYFILVILNAGSYFLMQLITNKSQKAQMELQTVDGQGAQTQKMMMWIMPIMMAFFAFMYTAAFSIYIVLSSFISMLTTFVINKIVDSKYKNQSADKKQVIRGRVYETPVKEEKPKEKQKTGLFGKKEETPQNDFLSGTADKKKKKKNN